MSRLKVIFLLLNLFVTSVFLNVRYGENVFIYQENGSILNFLYAEFYKSKNELKIKNDRHINLDNKNIWILLDPDNLDSRLHIKYGDKIKLSIHIGDNKFYINQRVNKTKIKKSKKNSVKIISSYYDLRPQKAEETDLETVKNVGVFTILNPLDFASRKIVDDSKPFILKAGIDGEEAYLTSTAIIDDKPNIWYIKPERLL